MTTANPGPDQPTPTPDAEQEPTSADMYYWNLLTRLSDDFNLGARLFPGIGYTAVFLSAAQAEEVLRVLPAYHQLRPLFESALQNALTRSEGNFVLNLKA